MGALPAPGSAQPFGARRGNAGVGRKSFDDARLIENIRAFMDSVLKAYAAARGLFVDSMNSNTFQDQPATALSYRFGSLTHTDPRVRDQAIAHNLDLRTATARVAEARAYADVAFGKTSFRPGHTPIPPSGKVLGGAELAAEIGAVSADHLLHASDDGIRAMAGAGVVATLLPATAFSLREPYARGRFMIDAGCAVALATDFNPGTAPSLHLPLAMMLACTLQRMTPSEVLWGVTTVAAGRWFAR